MGRTRATIVVIGACMAALALVTFMAVPEDLAYAGWMWPVLMTAGSLSCWTFAVHIASATWWWLSRSATVLGVMSRSGLVWQQMARHEYPNKWLGVGSFIVAVLAAYALHRLWFIDFRYWSRRAAQESTT